MTHTGRVLVAPPGTRFQPADAAPHAEKFGMTRSVLLLQADALSGRSILTGTKTSKR